MDAHRKRKLASSATPSSSEGSASKKLKLLNSNNPSAPKSNVQELGQRLLDQLRQAKDKSGHLIATQFLALPPRDELPDYYQSTKLPIALDTIEKKLQRNAFPTMTALECDFKRMVQNAKEYNAPRSDIYEDAERIRKLVYNYMKQNNPQYEDDPNYVSFATPIPQLDGANRSSMNHEMEDAPTPRETIEKPKITLVKKQSEPPADRSASIAPSVTTINADHDEEAGHDGGDIDFTGMSYQEAQQRMIAHLLHYTDKEGLEVYTPFGNLPTRKLEDYYQLIKHPVSLKAMAKRARGIHGRNPPTNITDFKTWDAFAEEMSFIWRNAQEYNEEGSDMYNLATDFKSHFEELIADAKDKVEEPAGPRLKLGGPKPKVTLNLSQHRNSPTHGVHVDNEALLRQQQMVAAGVNGQQRQRPAPMTNGVHRSSSVVPTTDPPPQSSGIAASPPGASVKAERLTTQSPAMAHAVPGQHPAINGMMPPPMVRPPSSSPFPLHTATSSYHYTAPGSLPPVPTRQYPIEQVLLPTVTISTHPQLPIPKRFSISIPPHSTLSQQSTTITLPNSHYFLQICPQISKQLSMGRPYKLFVTLNGVRLNQRDTQFHADTGKRTHVYEGSLMQGVNRIEVEAAASKVDRQGKKEGLDIEKVTVFANLMRA